jgi:hypothetical protein
MSLTLDRPITRTVEAVLNYLAPVVGRPRTYAHTTPPGEPRSTALPEPHVVPIHDDRTARYLRSYRRRPGVIVDHTLRRRVPGLEDSREGGPRQPATRALDT